jgi:hypothetical protein
MALRAKGGGRVEMEGSSITLLDVHFTSWVSIQGRETAKCKESKKKQGKGI